MMFGRALLSSSRRFGVRSMSDSPGSAAVAQSFLMATGVATGLGIVGGFLWKLSVTGPCKKRIDAYYASQS
jgi:hypothetical protein